MANGPPTPLALDEVIDDRYRLVRELAAGGMGVVYEAEHLGLQKRVALKLLLSDVADVPGMAQRFEREARATSRLDHEHVVRVTDFGRTATGSPYIVMELLVGRSLGDVLEAEGRLAPARTVAIGKQMLAGLGAAHEQGLVHRDLKPDNIFLCDRGEKVKVLDFGIAAFRGPQVATKLTRTGSVMGTPAYMAPEQAMGRGELDARTDLHAVGAMLYEMLAGHPPYLGENYNQILHAVLTGKPARLEEVRPGLAPSLYAAIARALAPDPDDRFATAADFAAALSGEIAAPAFRMPSKLAVTDLREPTATPARAVAVAPTASYALPTPAASPAAPPPARPAAVEPLALELDRPAPPLPAPTADVAVGAPAPASRRVAWIFAGLAALGVAGAGGWWALRPANVTIDLVAVPDGARLLLDGTPILGRRLLLPRSAAAHLLVVERRREGRRTIRFDASRDRQLDVTREGAP